MPNDESWSPSQSVVRCPSQGPRRYAYVDLLRGLAAFAVLITHYRWLYARQPMEMRTDVALPFQDLLWPLYEYGGLAVQLFWCLSGFVFAVAYGRFGKTMSLREFWVHRFARLYPLHLVTLLFVAFVQTISIAVSGKWLIFSNNDPAHFIAQLFLASNWTTDQNTFNGPIWSVSVEVVVYFIFLIYMRMFGFRLWPAIAFVAIGYFATRLPVTMIPMCTTLFFLGVVLAIVLPRFQRITGRALPWWSMGCLAGVITIALVLSGAGREAQAHRVLVFGGPAMIVLLFASLDLTARPLSDRFAWIGAITYSVYLLHMPLLITTKLLAGNSLYSYLASPWSLAAYCCLVVALSVPVHYFFELPAQKRLRSMLASPARQTLREA